jgi:methionine biosynthesis protein MetW
MRRQQIKRETDLQIISGWIEAGSRVLDVGCGRGILLEHLMRSLEVKALGVDTDLSKIKSCVKRAVPAYHGEAETLFSEFPDHTFDWVILSRTVQELDRPGDLIEEALRIGQHVAIGFVNQGYWLNRWATLLTGSRPTNEVFPLSWDRGHPYNPVTVKGFTAFAAARNIHIANAVYLKGDWQSRTRFLPNLTAGYALFHLRPGGSA